MNQKYLLLCLIMVLASCKQNNSRNSTTEDPVNDAIFEQRSDAASAFTKSIYLIHNKDAWEAKTAVSVDLEVDLNGEQLLKGKLTSQINSSRIRLDKNDGTKLVYNGNEIFLCPQEANDSTAKFDTFGWEYLLTLPFKLSDPGSKMEVLGQREMQNEILNRARFIPDPTSGLFNDKGLILYQESETGLLYGATFELPKMSAGKEEENIVGVIYRDYDVVEGVPIPTTWTFHEWSEQHGFGELIGEVELENIIFFEAQDELFEKPENSKILE